MIKGNLKLCSGMKVHFDIQTRAHRLSSLRLLLSCPIDELCWTAGGSEFHVVAARYENVRRVAGSLTLSWSDLARRVSRGAVSRLRLNSRRTALGTLGSLSARYTRIQSRSETYVGNVQPAQGSEGGGDVFGASCAGYQVRIK